MKKKVIRDEDLPEGLKLNIKDMMIELEKQTGTIIFRMDATVVIADDANLRTDITLWTIPN